MKETTYTDLTGRHWWVLLPDEAPDDEAHRGMPVGPPPLDDLELPEHIAVRLHNALHSLHIRDEREAVRRQADIASAIRGALRLDIHRIVALYGDRDILSHSGGRTTVAPP